MKIYTKAGDTGDTVLLGGTRVPKSDQRVKAYGAVDELNAQLGVVLSLSPQEEIMKLLIPLQHELFTLGADISAPLDARSVKPIPRITKVHSEQLEHHIDALEATLPAIAYFIIPGGSERASALHLARTICRRAERETVALAHTTDITQEVIVYLNRLSDFLFVLARKANQLDGFADIKAIL